MIEALEGVSDQDLFNEANADEAPADEAVVEAPEAEVEQEQPRDDHGRFTEAKDQIEALAPKLPIAGTEQPAPTVDDNAAMVPSWRVREINEEKRGLAEKLATLEAERVQWQQRQQLAPQPVTQPTRPDPLLDPDGFAAAVREEIKQEMLSDRRETSLSKAHKTYGKEFEEAYEAAQKGGVDPVLKVKMHNSRDPGETLMAWHRERKTMAEVGNDPNAYFDKRFEAYLSDPANQAKVLERIRGGVQQPGAAKQAAPVNLPPSLTRATNASTATSADDDDVSNDGLWRHANA